MLRWTAGVFLVPALIAGAAIALYGKGHPSNLIRIAVEPKRLEQLAFALSLGAVVWLMVIIATYLRTRPMSPKPIQRVLGPIFTLALCFLAAAPLVKGAQYSLVQRNLILTAVSNEHTITAPTIHATKKNEWGTKKRINLMLLGGDGGVGRTGIRTDTVIVASIDTKTGRTVLFSLPRNLRNVPFPEGTPLHDRYPNGFIEGSSPGESMLNAIYRNVPAYNPGVLAGSQNEGADALKLGVSGALGIPIDYYLLINLNGFEQIVNAIGGITVNVNYPVPINGADDSNTPPTGYIQPGPNQHLDGFHALWFTRGRYGLNDYLRMQRQRCAMKAIVDEANPMRLLTRYTKLAEATKKILRTDVPQSRLPAFVDLALKIKQHPLTSVVFQRTAAFDPNDPDYDYVHAQVLKALNPVKHGPKPFFPRGAAALAFAGTTVELPLTGNAYTNEATDVNADCTYQPLDQSQLGQARSGSSVSSTGAQPATATAP